MNRNAGKKKQIELRRARISELYIQGIKNIYELADIVGVTYMTVSRDLKELTKRWQESSLINTDCVKGERLKELSEIKKSNWEAWHRSIEKFKSKTIKARGSRSEDKQSGKADAQIIEQLSKTEERCGNPRYHSNILDAIKEECKIYGLYAPTKQEHSGKDGGPITFENTRDSVRKQLESNPDLMEKLNDAFTDG